MLDLSTILGFVAQFTGLDVNAQLATFFDSFGYSILLWLLNLGSVI